MQEQDLDNIRDLVRPATAQYKQSEFHVFRKSGGDGQRELVAYQQGRLMNPVRATDFMPVGERRAFLRGLAGEEADHFRQLSQELAERIQTMPRTYGQDGLGDQAVVYLHYFSGSADWYITELDAGGEDDIRFGQQTQAFGVANLGYGAELGYISIEDLVAEGVELDLYWTPRPLAEIPKATVQ